jgi:hypothetical protein
MADTAAMLDSSSSATVRSGFMLEAEGQLAELAEKNVGV